MKTTRRGFLAGASAAALVAGCTKDAPDGADSELQGSPQRGPEPERWMPVETEDTAAFPYALASTDVTDDSVILAIRCEGEQTLALQVVQADGEDWTLVHHESELTTVDGFYQQELSGLSADTAYNFAFLTPDGRRSPVGRFRTALAAGQDRYLLVGATSCLNTPNAPWPNMSHAAELDCDVFLQLGDTVYADGSETLEDYRAYWAQAFSTRGLNDVLRSTSTIATWDDHEVENNWTLGENVTQEKLDAAVAAFREHLPWREGGGDFGLWRKLSWGAVADIFVLESRGARIAAEGVYLSPEQMEWLKSGLATSTSRFKLIVNSVPIGDFTEMLGDAEAADRWQGFPEQRAEILGHIEDQGIDGVLWISGDMHFGSVIWVSPEGELGADQREVMVGPAGSTRMAAVELFPEGGQYTELLGLWNSVTFGLDATLGTVLVRFYGDEGEILAEHTLAL